LVLISAWHQERALFLVLVGWGLASDVIDGRLARRVGPPTERGARLDSRADLVFLSAAFVGALITWPILLEKAAVSVWLLFAAWAGPIAFGWIKFRRLTAYHTILARVALTLLAIGFLLLVVSGGVWLWQLGTGVLVISAIEELIITWRLATPLSDVPHCLALLRGRNRATPVVSPLR
jgi:CDP-diacylglycerol--glycerol-3-phosphate 3-phosphatidyltransferase